MSESARIILEQMEPDRGYAASELMTFADLNMDALCDVMHELWIAREVERFGERGWRRVRTTRRPQNLLESMKAAARSASATGGARDTTSLRIGAVRPEDLFDHDSFAEWFKQA